MSTFIEHAMEYLLKKSIAGIKDILRDILNHKETDKKTMTT